MKGPPGNLTVLMIPYYGDQNPYQALLCEKLEASDIRVIRSHSIGRFAILNDIRAHRLPDVLHLHWLHPFTFTNRWFMTVLGGIRLLSELLLLRLLGVRIVWTVHNILEHKRQQPTLERAIKHLVVRLCNHVIVHCEIALELAIDMYRLPERLRERFVVIPHGNYISAYPNETDSIQAKHKLGIEEAAGPVFLFFGKIRSYKNIPELIDTFQRLEAPDARLLVVGDPANNKLETDVLTRCKQDNRVHAILEYVPNEKVQHYMNAADVVVLPFDRILTSGSILLAMSFGKAVIAPPIGCVGELLDPEGSYMYEPGNNTGLKHAMERALDANLDAMGEYNYQKAKRYDWETIAEQTLDAYRGTR